MVNICSTRPKREAKKTSDNDVFDAAPEELLNSKKNKNGRCDKVVMPRRPNVRSVSSPFCSGSTSVGGGGIKRQDSGGSSVLKDIRLVVLGAGRVGKSAMVKKFLFEEFSNKYVPTVEDCYRHIVQLPDGQLHNVEIVDTAGLHQFPAMRNLRVSTGHAFIVVYAIDDASSFHEAQELIELIYTLKGECTVPVALVGSKADRRMSREVKLEQALAVADKYGCATEEISSIGNKSVDFIFGDLLAQTISENTKCKRSSSLTDQYSLRISLAIMNSVSRKHEIRKLRNNQDKKCTIL